MKITVTANSTTTSLSANPSSVAVGQTVLLTATVASSGGTPTGAVRFYDGTTLLQNTTLDGSGVAVYAAAFQSVGTHVISATYPANASFLSSTSSPVNVIVTASAPNETTTGLNATPNEAVVRGYILTAKVSAWTGNEDGSVIFMDGGSQLGATVLDKTGTATYQSSSLTLGLHYITAFFPGTATQGASASPVLIENIPTDAPDFSMYLSPQSSVVRMGTSTQVRVNILALNQFGGNVGLSCSTGTPLLNCSLQPEAVQGGSGISTLMITASGTGNSVSSIPSRPAYAVALSSFAFILSFVFLRRRHRTSYVVLLSAILAVGIMLGCGSSPSGGKTNNFYTVTVTASSGHPGPVIIHVATLQVEATLN